MLGTRGEEETHGVGWRVELFDIPRARGERKVERSVHRGCRLLSVMRVSAYQQGHTTDQ